AGEVAGGGRVGVVHAGHDDDHDDRASPAASFDHADHDVDLVGSADGDFARGAAQGRLASVAVQVAGLRSGRAAGWGWFGRVDCWWFGLPEGVEFGRWLVRCAHVALTHVQAGIAWFGWGAGAVESDVFVGVAGSGSDWGSEFLY